MKILNIENLTYQVPFGKLILKDINLELSPGKVLGILGHNGSGKTTLIDLILGLKKVTQGKVSVLGEDPHSLHRVRKDKLCFLSQDVTIDNSLSVEDYLTFHSCFYQNYSREEEKYFLELFGLKKLQKIGSLSTGQQKKVQIIAGLSTLPALILIDEITAVLDPETRSLFFKEIRRMKSQYQSSVIIATNIAEDLVHTADEVLYIENQKATFHSPEEIDRLFNLGITA